MPESDKHLGDSLDKVLEKESRSGRALSRPWQAVLSALGILMVGVYFYAAGIAPLDTQYHRGIYVLLTYVMILLAYPARSKSSRVRPTVIDGLLVFAAVVSVGYFILEFEAFNYRSGNETSADVWISVVGVLVSLEVCRRVLGWSMTLVGVFFLVWGIWGNVFPEPFTHRGFNVERMAVSLFMEQSGVFGIMANVLVNYVILFIFFGAFLKKSGVGRFFIDWPMAFAGGTAGGPAKVAVIASAFFGSVSGSAIANTVSTGAFTIPLMKRAGFRPHVAGAIEPSASIGGMFMPPIMGAGGFLMAELTRVPYVDIMKMALFPALLYFFSVMTMIHFEAKRQNIGGMYTGEGESAGEIFRRHWYKSLPLFVVVALMLAGYSPGLSAFWATLSCIVVSWFDPEHRMGPREVLDAVDMGARNTLVIGATVGVIGIIVGTIALTGIGLKFSDIIISLSQGNLPLAIILIGIASLILGMGVPVTASYLIVAVLAVPALTQMMEAAGIPGHSAASMAIATHMIVYWFSQDSNITPPVCVAAYAGAAIAHSDPWKTGWTAFRFAKLLYVVPFLFAYQPPFLLYGTWVQIVMAFFFASVGTLAFSALTMGYLLRRTSIFEWLLLAAATFLCFYPDRRLGLAGLMMAAGVFVWQKWMGRGDAGSGQKA
ncbi:MAG: TRAP transporter permease [Pseudomonadota bacterium]|nr:TRAP transporter permease [Pseudomonadota bacterium]